MKCTNWRYATVLPLFWLAQPVWAEIQTQPIDYQAGHATLKGFIAYDDSSDAKRPGVLVVHEWWGHNEYARQRAKMLAELGYVALAVDMYGDGKSTTHPKEAGAFAKAALADKAVATARFQAAMTTLQQHPMTDPEQIAAIGYCFGGGVVLEMARRGLDLDGVASFHGSLGTDAPAERDIIKAPIMVFHGAADALVPEEAVASFKAEMKTAHADMTFISYPDVKHSFTNPEADAFAKEYGLPVAYDKAADEDSWAKMQAFFKTIFMKTPEK